MMSTDTQAGTKYAIGEVEAKRLGTLLAEIGNFASTDRTRPILTGVNIDAVASTHPACSETGFALRFCATDSYALGVITTNVPAPNGALSVIVDAKQLGAIAKQLSKITPNTYASSPSVTVTITERTFSVATSTWSLSADVIPGDFPNWGQLMPANVTEIDGEGAPAFNPAMLAGTFGKLTLCCERLTKRSTNGGLAVRYVSHGALKPASFVASTDHAEFVGLLMPVRVK